MKQTVVDWYIDELFKLNAKFNNSKYDNTMTLSEYSDEKDRLKSKAKAMEKEHIETAWHDGNLLGRNGWVEEEYNTGSQYYKQTYGGDK